MISLKDVGSGQGHLSRLMALEHKMRVVAIENQDAFVKKAQKFDKEAVDVLKVSQTVHKSASLLQLTSKSYPEDSI